MNDLITLVDQGIDLANGATRTDLVHHLEDTRRRLQDPNTRVMVVGELKQGKSNLINAIVGAPACPVDDDIATAVQTVVRYGETASARLLVTTPHDRDHEQHIQTRPIELDAIAEHVTVGAQPEGPETVLAVEVLLPQTVLQGGLSLVDSPGVGGLSPTHTLSTLTSLPSADAVLMVSDASQEFTASELQFLQHAMRICPNIACVLTKTDLYPDWREVAQRNRAHLDRLGPGIRLFPVSSHLRLKAIQLQDVELNIESGVSELVAYLRNDVLGRAEQLRRRAVAHELTLSTEHLALSLQSELAALESPADALQKVSDLEAAKDRAGELKRRSARWQTTLSDGVSDLISDMEYDLRDRVRNIQRDAEHAIDEADPGPIWDDLVDWLDQRLAAAVSDTFVWTDERAQWLALQVAEHFTMDHVPMPKVRVDGTEHVLDPVQAIDTLDPGYLTFTQKLLIGLRGSYGGVLMFGLLTAIFGMSLVNPISIGAGILMGAKAYKDEKEARLKRRRGEAKTLVRSHIDEVVFQVGKQLKDRLRLVQRTTRDHFIDIADEHQRSLGESVVAAQKAAATFSSERDGRIKEIKARLARLEELQRRARSLMPAPAGAPQR